MQWRFCSRMCGSPLDGEDVVQEALAEAFYNLSTLTDASRFEPWIFASPITSASTNCAGRAPG